MKGKTIWVTMLCGVLSIAFVCSLLLTQAEATAPLYDSGWVLSRSDGQMQHFDHALAGMATDFVFLAADDSDGNYPTVVPDRAYPATSQYRGVLVYCTQYGRLSVKWGANGIAREAAKGWYYPGDYVRLLVYETVTASESSGCPPYRP